MRCDSRYVVGDLALFTRTFELSESLLGAWWSHETDFEQVTTKGIRLSQTDCWSGLLLIYQSRENSLLLMLVGGDYYANSSETETGYIGHMIRRQSRASFRRVQQERVFISTLHFI